jgi:hypothetical protein
MFTFELGHLFQTTLKRVKQNMENISFEFIAGGGGGGDWGGRHLMFSLKTNWS